MPYKEFKIEKVFYSIGEVAEMFELQASTLRYWEQEFSVLKPKRNKKGTRYYTRKDIENLRLIHHLVKERGLTIKGARQKIKENRGDLDNSHAVIKKLQHIRSLLVRIRDEM
ncbi:MAG: MerR family transcriptional regulator [Bacteroidota bacterium]|nr:MerR family transcriptional regulator [Bacteroidota bacterium]